MNGIKKPTIGLALSGSGNRTPFYIGFLEVLSEHNIQVDYIAACSGGSLVAVAYACGTLPEFKKTVLSLTKESIKEKFLIKGKNGGIYSLDALEDEMKKYSKGQTFEDVKPRMGFVAVDIESGTEVLLNLGDLAHAAVISCALPGAFDPMIRGGQILVDGGLLTQVPDNVLVKAGIDIRIGINMRGTKHIFTEGQITLRKVMNFFKKILFIDALDGLFEQFTDKDEQQKNLGFFSVVGKSLDIAIGASKQSSERPSSCQLLITPSVPRKKRMDITTEALEYYYEVGRQTAEEYVPRIKELIKQTEQKKERIMA